MNTNTLILLYTYQNIRHGNKTCYLFIHQHQARLLHSLLISLFHPTACAASLNVCVYVIFSLPGRKQCCTVRNSWRLSVFFGETIPKKLISTIWLACSTCRWIRPLCCDTGTKITQLQSFFEIIMHVTRLNSLLPWM